MINEKTIQHSWDVSFFKDEHFRIGLVATLKVYYFIITCEKFYFIANDLQMRLNHMYFFKYLTCRHRNKNVFYLYLGQPRIESQFSVRLCLYFRVDGNFISYFNIIHISFCKCFFFQSIGLLIHFDWQPFGYNLRYRVIHLHI